MNSVGSSFDVTTGSVANGGAASSSVAALDDIVTDIDAEVENDGETDGGGGGGAHDDLEANGGGDGCDGSDNEGGGCDNGPILNRILQRDSSTREADPSGRIFR